MFFLKEHGARPAPFLILCDVEPTKRNGLSKPFSHIVGFCRERSQIETRIAEDLKAMGETYGGLIEAAGTKGRTYRVYEATWQEVPRG